MARAKKTASTEIPPTKASDSTSRKRPAGQTPSVPPGTHDVIAQRAYELFIQEGAQNGRDLEHWLRAEQELREGSSARRPS